MNRWKISDNIGRTDGNCGNGKGFNRGIKKGMEKLRTCKRIECCIGGWKKITIQRRQEDF